MRLSTLRTTAGARLFVRTAAGLVDVGRATGRARWSTMESFLAGGDEAWAAAAAIPPGDEGGDYQVAPAVPAPSKILCLGRNYLDHVREVGRETPDWPEVFLRAPTTITGPFDPIELSPASESFDYEGELGAVIGRTARDVPAGQALSIVAGYVVLNDVTARDWQWRGAQWSPGKNFDGTLPIGPELVTPDEVDGDDLHIETRLNGDVVQSASTAQMLFDLPTQIEFLSSFLTLHPGDVIATGTPSGVGAARQPSVFLRDSDVVEVSIAGVGTNPELLLPRHARPARQVVGTGPRRSTLMSHDHDHELGPVGTRLLVSNDLVNIWEVALAPGEVQGWHVHRYPYVVVVMEDSRSRIVDRAGELRTPASGRGAVVFDPGGVTHQLENIGETPIRDRIIEFKVPINEKLLREIAR